MFDLRNFFFAREMREERLFRNCSFLLSCAFYSKFLRGKSFKYILEVGNFLDFNIAIGITRYWKNQFYLSCKLDSASMLIFRLVKENVDQTFWRAWNL